MADSDDFIQREIRFLTEDEIRSLEDQGCWAEDWTKIKVSEDFSCSNLRNVTMFGDIRLGVFDKSVEVSKGFMKHSGIYNAVLRNVTVGDNCLIENIGNYIHNCSIGDDCYISNVGTIDTTEGATYGEGNVISVLNEAGDGNLVIFRDLNSQLADLMLKNSQDSDFKEAMRRMIRENITFNAHSSSNIGDRVKIINTTDITNTVISDDCEIYGAVRINDCTILGSEQSNVYIGSGVICENSIISDGSSLTNAVNLQDCFVGESCQIRNGFTASSSVFFANTVMSNGEACAAFCGPFSASHHKSSLLIGCKLSFYNAGSATNYSNHAYKMGPIHWGVLERGSKTASGAHLLLPCTIGAFSMCMGKISSHPTLKNLPFSYVIGEGRDTYVVPGRNIGTVGLYRDVNKWPHRDMRSESSKKSIVNQDWLSPYAVHEIFEGRNLLLSLRDSNDVVQDVYDLKSFKIKSSAVEKGIKLYDMALKLFMGKIIKRKSDIWSLLPITVAENLFKWDDLSGMLLPETDETSIVDSIKNGNLETIEDVQQCLSDVHAWYPDYCLRWCLSLICAYYGVETIDDNVLDRVLSDYENSLHLWKEMIRQDAEKEYALGDMDENVLSDFLEKLENDIK